ncbi:unnamed protein product [Protopolystoma xenopodis]|uniref:Uncharacterized protein n=1 Tax=Protopolystoma xenopodis TaxID=117903 RepID=A0A448WG45_9PLAT|nr:unnamed protein product [Protopolystoma xenopodis]
MLSPSGLVVNSLFPTQEPEIVDRSNPTSDPLLSATVAPGASEKQVNATQLLRRAQSCRRARSAGDKLGNGFDMASAIGCKVQSTLEPSLPGQRPCDPPSDLSHLSGQRCSLPLSQHPWSITSVVSASSAVSLGSASVNNVLEVNKAKIENGVSFTQDLVEPALIPRESELSYDAAQIMPPAEGKVRILYLYYWSTD